MIDLQELRNVDGILPIVGNSYMSTFDKNDDGGIDREGTIVKLHLFHQRDNVTSITLKIKECKKKKKNSNESIQIAVQFW